MNPNAKDQESRRRDPAFRETQDSPGARLRSMAMRTLPVSGLLGWVAGIGTLDWATSHDAKDPDQYVGVIWLLSTLSALGVACLGLVVVVLLRRSHPIVGRDWMAICLGASAPLAVLIFSIVAVQD